MNGGGMRRLKLYSAFFVLAVALLLGGVENVAAANLDLQSMVNNSLTGEVVVPPGQWVVGNVTAGNPMDIHGTSPDLCQLWGNITFNQGGSSLRNVYLNGSGPGSGTGVTFNNATSVILSNVLIQNFDIDAQVNAGGGWSILASRFYTPDDFGLVIKNVNNPDQGDWFIGEGCTFYGGPSTIAGIYFLSSGGGKIMGNKFLLGQWAILGSVQGVTSDMIIGFNSMEAQTVNFVHFVLNGGTFRNVQYIGNQTTTPNPIPGGGGAHFDNIPAVIAIGNLNTNPRGGTTVTSTDRVIANELLN